MVEQESAEAPPRINFCEGAACHWLAEKARVPKNVKSARKEASSLNEASLAREVDN